MIQAKQQNSKKTGSNGTPLSQKQQQPRQVIGSRPRKPEAAKLELRFSAYAWAKLLFLRDRGGTEVGGFAVTGDDPLAIEDIVMVKQTCSQYTVEFDDASVADFFEDQYDQGRQPYQCGRIWVHTHPMIAATPSWTDEDTFSEAFGKADWAVMFILAKGGEIYCRFRTNIHGHAYAVEIPVRVDPKIHFPESDVEAWTDEYERCVEVERPASRFTYQSQQGYYNGYDNGYFDPAEVQDEIHREHELLECELDESDADEFEAHVGFDLDTAAGLCGLSPEDTYDRFKEAIESGIDVDNLFS